MDQGKEKIKELFFKNVYGLSPNIESYDKKHAGARGHWLEKKLGKQPDASNEADFWGYECKAHTNSKTSWGDWSPSEFIFDKGNPYQLSRDKFLQLFGKPNIKKNNRYSWSGEPIPKSPCKISNFGQSMEVDRDLNVLIKYNFSKDQRVNKIEIVPKYFQIEGLILAKWYGYESNIKIKKNTRKSLETRIKSKFNQKGWFKCIMKNNIYEKIVFGAPVNFETWINYLKLGDIYFDSAMKQRNSRNYCMWRSDNSFWNKLIVEEFTRDN